MIKCNNNNDDDDDNVEEYEFLYVLSNGQFKNCYKVKHKVTGEEFVWKCVQRFSDNSKNDKNEDEKCNNATDKYLLLLNRIEELISKTSENANVVKCSTVRYDGNFYLSVEPCVETNLCTILEKFRTKDEYFCEPFIWRTIYQLCCVNKIFSTEQKRFDPENLYLSPNNDIKVHFLDFLIDAQQENANPTTTSFVQDLYKLLYELCTLEPFSSTKTAPETLIPNWYSEDLRKFLQFIKDLNPQLNPDVVLCHPTVLIKQSKHKEPLAKISESKIKHHHHQSVTSFQSCAAAQDADYQSRLENLRNREAALKLKEEFIREQERNMHKREKKVALQERMVKEKLQRANLYLKRCKESRSSLQQHLNKENVAAKRRDPLHVEPNDTSYSADPGDTSIIPTSTRMRIEDIHRPAFAKPLTDNGRKVRFKGHSPLKEQRFPAREHHKSNALLSDRSTPTSESLSEKSCVTESKKKCGLFRMLSTRSKKNAAANVANTTNDTKTDGGSEKSVSCRPISWTEQNKRQAFELLRIMNGEDRTTDVYPYPLLKHTHL